MTKNQVEVITSVQRRRRWAISEKERIVAEALAPGAMVSEVARAAVWLATGHTDFDGLAPLVQETLRRNPHNGPLFVFRGRRGSLKRFCGTMGRRAVHLAIDCAAGQRRSPLSQTVPGPSRHPESASPAHL
jgi:transposase